MTTIKELQEFIAAERMNPEDCVTVNNGQEACTELDFRRGANSLVIHAGDSENRAKIEALEECTANAAKALAQAENIIDETEFDKDVDIKKIRALLSTAQTHLEA